MKEKMSLVASLDEQKKISLDVEEAGTCLFLQILSDDTVENHGDLVSPSIRCQSFKIQATFSQYPISTSIQLIVIEKLFGNFQKFMMRPEIHNQFGYTPLVILST